MEIVTSIFSYCEESLIKTFSELEIQNIFVYTLILHDCCAKGIAYSLHDSEKMAPSILPIASTLLI